MRDKRDSFGGAGLGKRLGKTRMVGYQAPTRSGTVKFKVRGKSVKLRARR
jgi:hypothetical protein